MFNKGSFENITKIAIEEIIKSHANISKFGYIIDEEGLQDIIEDFYTLLITSRNLKTAGDRILKEGGILSFNNIKSKSLSQK